MTESEREKPPGTGLSDAKRRLLAARLAGRGGSRPEPPIRPRPADARVRATPYQEAIWLLSRLVDAPGAYNIHMALELRGRLDLEVLARAWTGVTDRHEALRLVIRRTDAGLDLCFDAVESIPLEHHVVSGGGQDPANARRQAATRFARRAFDTDTGPLCRAGLFTSGEQGHLLVVAVHHVVCDERGLEVMLRDLLQAYAGQPADVSAADARVDFGDYAYDLPARLAKSFEDDLGWWSDALAGMPEALDLPTDRPRPEPAGYAGRLVSRQCGPALAAGFRDRVGNRDFFATGLAALQLLLSRYCGQADVAVGSPMTLRNQEETAGMVGLFINPVVLRAQVPDIGSLRDFRERTRSVVNETLDHRALPFEQVVAELSPRRGASHNPFFQVMFVLETEPRLPTVPGLAVTPARLDTGTAKMDLTLFLGYRDDALVVTAEYNTELFDDNTLAALLAAYEQLLEAFVFRADSRIDEIALVAGDTAGEGAANLVGPRIATAAGPLLPAQISAAARKAPARAALCMDDGQVSYALLARRADAIARVLRDRGAGADRLVGVLMEPGPDYVVAILAVLRSGAAYVPLDPTWPRERLATIFDDLRRQNGGVALVATAGGSHGLSHIADSADLVGVDIGAVSDLAQGAEPPHLPAPAADDLAYVIYTSGSTGRPKGVAVEHGHLLDAQTARTSYYGDTPETFLLVSPLVFDSSVAGLFWTLAGGGTLVLPREDARADARYLAALIAQHGVSHVLLLPSLYALLLRTADGQQLAGLKTVIVAGEACPPALVDLHRRLLPQTEFVNEYGPTETTVWATAWHAMTDAPPVSLGWPVANTRLLVVDQCGQPLPPGAAGELWIGGEGVARGYLGDPGLTAERFVTRIPGPDVRWYRTGDRVRQRSDGALEFLGRLDAQVKIRGHRVEPEVVEDELRSLPDIHDVAVVADSGGSRLIAWCVPGAGGLADTTDLRGLLSGRVPASHIPELFLPVDRLPRTATGKVDRRKLTARPLPRRRSERVGKTPFNATEASLARIWQRLLRTDDVGPDTDFFEAGGHSLLGVQLLVEIETRFARSLPLAALFESPTLAGLAARIEASGAGADVSAVSPVRDSGTRIPLFCVHGGIRRVAPYLDPNRPLYLVYRELDTSAFADLSVPELAASYLSEVRKLRPAGPYHLCGFSFGGQVAYEMARQLQAAGESVGLLGLLDPPPVSQRTYAFELLRRKWAQVISQDGWAARLRFLLSELTGGTARVANRRRTYYSARRHERSGASMRTEELQERDRRNYIRASRSYAYPPLDLPAVLVMPERVERVRRGTVEGFSERLPAGLDVFVAEGARAHEDIMQEPHCQWLAAVLETAMDAAERRTGQV